jgi:hypothetical protein
VWWLKRGRKVDKTPVLEDGYAKRWQKWWMEMQPKARIASEWPPSRVVSDDTTWAVLGRVGPTGFVMVMMALSWWAVSALSGTEGSVEEAAVFHDAVDDVNWVLGQMLCRTKNDTVTNLNTSNKRRNTSMMESQADDLLQPASKQ